MRGSTLVVLIGMALAITLPATAQESGRVATPAAPQAAPTLRAGMPAPEFKVEKFLKGAAFTGLEKGKVYVIEFWATWCGPCVMSMPHLSELQREYADKGVTICGVNIWEDKTYSDATLPKVMKFVEGKGAGMDYSVAFDGASKFMDTTWMAAAGRKGIPSAFVVDKNGTIAWMGHPMLLDMVIDEVVKGEWDATKGAEKITEANRAFTQAGKAYKESMLAGDAAWKEAMKRYPLMGRTRSPERFGAMIDAGHTKEACAIGEDIVGKAANEKNAGPIMQVLNALDNPKLPATPEAKQLLLKAATANLDLADKSQAGPWVTMARAYYFNGESDKGHEAAKKALELSRPETRKAMEAWLKELEESASGKK